MNSNLNSNLNSNKNLKENLNSNKLKDKKQIKNNAQFVLLSAFCCGKPVLQFQFAKLKLEEDIKNRCKLSENMTHSIVRPTAYFKSLDGQIESAKKGKYIKLFSLLLFFSI